MNLYEVIQKMCKLEDEDFDYLTKLLFGQAMHNPENTEEYKQRILVYLEEHGGYENLPD